MGQPCRSGEAGSCASATLTVLMNTESARDARGLGPGRSPIVVVPHTRRAGGGRWEVEAEMDEPQIHGSIEKLVAEEHDLWERESAGEATDADRRRLEEIKISLDQCWDLLRQRRALGDAGKDPEGAQARRPEIVERYQQ